jgi:hypothetical protein
VLGLLAAIPVIVATAHALDFGWTPSSDDGVIALRAFDVLSTHPPLVGQYSQSSPLIGEPTYSLGPMLYWLLAIPAHMGPTAIVLTTGAVSTAAVVGAVAIAGRRGGWPLALVTAAAVVLICRSLPAEIPYEVWNCWAGVFPFMLLLFVAWSVACGDYRLLPVLALTASYVAQVHYTYLLPVAGATAVAIGGLVLWRRQRQAPSLVRWAIAALAIVVVCWIPPAIEQVRESPGNLDLAIRLATDDHERLGAEAGLREGARAIGVPPWWLLPDRGPVERILATTRMPPLGAATALLVLAALAGLLLAAVRRGCHDAATALALALVMCLSLLFVAASIPTGVLGFAAAGYVFAWTSPAGMFVWLALGWSAVVLFAPWRLPLPRRGIVAAASGLAVLAVAVTVGRDYESPNRLPPGLKDYALVDDASERVVDALAGSKAVLLDVPIEVRNSLTFQSAITYALRREGLAIGVPPRLVKELGDQYAASPGAYDHVVSIRDGGSKVSGPGRVIVRTPEVTVLISRAR